MFYISSITWLIAWAVHWVKCYGWLHVKSHPNRWVESMRPERLWSTSAWSLAATSPQVGKILVWNMILLLIIQRQQKINFVTFCTSEAALTKLSYVLGKESWGLDERRWLLNHSEAEAIWRNVNLSPGEQWTWASVVRWPSSLRRSTQELRNWISIRWAFEDQIEASTSEHM